MEHNHEISDNNEKKVMAVVILTVCTMIAEIIYGYITKSMALLADGYHMGTHAVALSLTYIAYVLIRKFNNSPLFPNGTSKIGTLTAYTSSLFLGVTGFWIIFEALIRFFHPIQIQFNEAIIVAFIGLLVNSACIYIMERPHNNHCEHCGANEKLEQAEADKEDYNFMSAYYHILADILTSIFAIIALFAGKYLDMICFDSLVGILGGVLILRWSASLIKNTAAILIDMKH